MQLSTICPLTTADALARAVAVAPDVEALVAAGIGRGDHVGLCLGNGVRWVSLFLALGSLGAVTVPVNTRFRGGEMAYVLRQSRVSALFIADRFLNIDFIAALRGICPGIDAKLPDPALPDLRRVFVVGDDVPLATVGLPEFRAMAAGAADPVCTPDDVLLIQYTSGTTSLPKARC